MRLPRHCEGGIEERQAKQSTYMNHKVHKEHRDFYSKAVVTLRPLPARQAERATIVILQPVIQVFLFTTKCTENTKTFILYTFAAVAAPRQGGGNFKLS